MRDILSRICAATIMSGSNNGLQPHSGDTAPDASVLTGASGMAMINDMFQRQARRLETQQHLQAQDRKTVEYTQAQLLVMQSQLQWHTMLYQERAEQVSKSADTIARMQSYLGTMEVERERAVETATILARDVNGLRQHMETTHPERLETLSTTLSDMAMRGTDLASIDGVGQFFTPGGGAKAPVPSVEQNSGGLQSLSRSSIASMSVTSSSRHRHDAAVSTMGTLPLHNGERSSNSGGSQQLSNGSGSDGDGANGSGGEAHNDNSSSDSADAASAASTWPHAVATRRGSKEVALGKGAHPELAPPPREGSPPENDSASGDGSTASNGGTGGQRPDSGSESKSDENGSPPPDSCGPSMPTAAVADATPNLPTAHAATIQPPPGTLPPVAEQPLQQGLVGSLPTGVVAPGMPAAGSAASLPAGAGVSGCFPSATTAIPPAPPPVVSQLGELRQGVIEPATHAWDDAAAACATTAGGAGFLQGALPHAPLAAPAAHLNTLASLSAQQLTAHSLAAGLANPIHAANPALASPPLGPGLGGVGITSPTPGGGVSSLVQGVLPFPGQGIVELQQGVIVNQPLEEFHGVGGGPLPFNPATSGAAVSVAPLSKVSMGAETLGAASAVRTAEEPPAKRIATSLCDMSLASMPADTLDVAVSRSCLRPEFDTTEVAAALGEAGNPASSGAMDTS